jgi:hypothetical protein
MEEQVGMLSGLGLSAKSDWIQLFAALIELPLKDLRFLGKYIKAAGHLEGAVSKANKTSLADRIAQAIPVIWDMVDSGAHDVPELAHVDDDGEEQPGLSTAKEEKKPQMETIVINGKSVEIEAPLDECCVHTQGVILAMEDDSPEGQLGMTEPANRRFNFNPDSVNGRIVDAIKARYAQGMRDAHEGSEMANREWNQLMWQIASWHCPKGDARAKGKDWELGRWLARNKELVEVTKNAKTKQQRLEAWAFFTLRGRRYYRDVRMYWRVTNAIKEGQKALIGMKASEYWQARKEGKDPAREAAIKAFKRPAYYSTR